MGEYPFVCSRSEVPYPSVEVRVIYESSFECAIGSSRGCSHIGEVEVANGQFMGVGFECESQAGPAGGGVSCKVIIKIFDG